MKKDNEENVKKTDTPVKVAPRTPAKGKRTLRHEFKTNETIEIAKDLGEKLNERNQIEADADRMKSDFKARTSANDAAINSLRDKVTSGYELRLIDVETRYDDPVVGLCSTYRLDTGAQIENRQMTEYEKQIELPLDEKKTVHDSKKKDDGVRRTIAEDGVIVTAGDQDKDTGEDFPMPSGVTYTEAEAKAEKRLNNIKGGK